MPFRITNGPTMFQRFINHIFADLAHLDVFPYMDDIIIASQDPTKHDDLVREVLSCLRSAELQADIKKSKFNVQSVKFLGHVISTTGISIDPEKVEAIQEWPLPTSVKAIQSFTSFASYYRDLCPKLAAPSAILSAFIRKGHWKPLGAKEIKAFEEIKRLFTIEEIVTHFDESAYETSLNTDASDGALARALHQRLTKDSPLRPVAFFSCKLADTEMRYDIYDKEMLAVVTSIRHFRKYLLSAEKTFTVYTDYKALEYFSVKQELNARQMRWSELIADYDYQITYRKGSENIAADALTRKQEEYRTQKAKDEASRYYQLIPTDQLCALTRATARATRDSPAVLVEIPTEDFVDAAESADSTTPEPATSEPVDRPDYTLQRINSGVKLEPNPVPQLEQSKAESTSNPAPESDYMLIDKVLLANWKATAFRKHVQGKGRWNIHRDLLVHDGRLYVDSEPIDLWTRLIATHHDPPTAGHPSHTKTLSLI